MNENKLKSITKIGDKYHIYYKGTVKKPGFKKVVRFTDKSIWLKSNTNVTTRYAWKTLSDYINKNVFRKS